LEWAIIAGALAIIAGACGFILWSERRAGQSEQLATNLAATSEATHAMLQAAVNSPSDRASVVASLRDRSF